MSDRAPTPERLRELAREAQRLDHGRHEALARQRFRQAVTPETVAALVDRLEALADKVQGCVLCDDDASTNPNCHDCTAAGAEADFAEKIRALLREPLDPEPQDNTEDV